MPQLRALALLLIVALVGVAVAYQEKDKDKDPKDKVKKDDKDKADDKDKDKKLKGYLPANFKKLGLSEAQVQKIYKLQADYDVKQADLKRQMEKLKAQEKEAVEGVLTPEQRKELDRIRLGKKEK
jgi:hypothetical protein